MTHNNNQGFVNYKLRKFDMRWISRDSRVLFLGKSGTGKSTLVKDLLWHHRKIAKGICISGTQDGLEEYGELMPELYIYDEYDQEILQKIIKTQRASIKKKGKEKTDDCFLIMDDCLYDDKWTKHKEMRYIFFNSRHDKILFLLTMQFPMGIPPALRSNANFVFILRDSVISNRKRIYEQYAGMFPNFDVFCNIMDQCTEDFECLVIHNTSKSNRFEDQVFWYKANIHEPFRIGSKKFWKYHQNKFNEEHDIIRNKIEQEKEHVSSHFTSVPKRKGISVILDKEDY